MKTFKKFNNGTWIRGRVNFIEESEEDSKINLFRIFKEEK